MFVLRVGISCLIDIHQIDYVIGCASVSLSSGHCSAQTAIQCHPFQLNEDPLTDKGRLPSMFETYLHLGAQVWNEAPLDLNLDVVNLFSVGYC